MSTRTFLPIEGTLMETPTSSTASQMPWATPPGPMPSAGPDFTVQPLDSTNASHNLTEIEV